MFKEQTILIFHCFAINYNILFISLLAIIDLATPRVGIWSINTLWLCLCVCLIGWFNYVRIERNFYWYLNFTMSLMANSQNLIIHCYLIWLKFCSQNSSIFFFLNQSILGQVTKLSSVYIFILQGIVRVPILIHFVVFLLWLSEYHLCVYRRITTICLILSIKWDI